jgi:hypothetical protein
MAKFHAPPLAQAPGTTFTETFGTHQQQDAIIHQKPTANNWNNYHSEIMNEYK